MCVFFQAIGLPLHSAAHCDSKKASQTFLTSIHKQQVGCVFKSIHEVSERGGHCLTHKTHCTLDGAQPDMVVIGPPCQPFSRMRDRRKQTPAAHRDYQVTFEEFPGYLQRVRPHGGLLEQVPSTQHVTHPVGLITQQKKSSLEHSSLKSDGH